MEAEPLNSPPPIRKRRWYQFSLRSLMILTLVIAVPCALLGRRIEWKRRERAAVKTLAKQGSVRYDYQSRENGGLKSEPPGPKWLRGILGDDFFAEATVFYSEASREQSDLPRLKDALEALPRLKEVDMCAINFRDADLACFEELTQIETLDLMASTEITDAGLTHFKRLTALKYLHVGGQFSGAAISELQKALPNCEIGM
jgi:hypothetical protein